MSRTILLTAICVVIAGTCGNSVAEESPTEFTGAFEFGLSKTPVDAAVVCIRDEKMWSRFLAKIPKLVPGRTTRLDTPNDNPVLKAKIDWKEKMAIVVVSRNDIPTIEFAGIKEKSEIKGASAEIFLVEYSLIEDFSAHPVDWGTFVARIVPRSTHKVVTRKVEPKPVEP